jgi:hypothetical protein
MKLVGILALAAAALFGVSSAASAAGFTGVGSANEDPVSSLNSSGGADFEFRTLNKFGKNTHETADHVSYWNDTVYSHDNALVSAIDGDVFEMSMIANPGRVFTSVTLHFGALDNTDTSTDWDVWDAFFSFIDGGTLAIDGDTGGLVTLSGLHVHSFRMQFGTSRTAGLQGVDFTTAAIATPIPGALLLFGTALGGLGFAGVKRRRRDAAA